MKRKIKVYPFGYDPIIAGCRTIEDMKKLGIKGDIVDMLEVDDLKKKAKVIELEKGEDIPDEYRFLWHEEIK